MSVVEQVAHDGDTIRFRDLHVRTGLFRYVGKTHLAQITKNGVRLGVCAIGELSYVVENIAAGHEEILQAIIVEIGDSIGPSGHLQGGPRKTAAARDINKDVVAAIAKKGKRLQLRSRVPDVRQTVIVQVAKLCSHSGNGFAIFGISYADVHGDLFESFAFKIMKESVRHVVVG